MITKLLFEKGRISKLKERKKQVKSDCMKLAESR
jgi:hypothetical protein